MLKKLAESTIVLRAKMQAQNFSRARTAEQIYVLPESFRLQGFLDRNFRVVGEFAHFDFDSHAEQFFQGLNVLRADANRLRNHGIAVFKSFAAKIDRFERDSAFDRANNIGGIREQEQRLEGVELRIFVRLASLFDRNNVTLKSGRNYLQQEFFAEFVLGNFVADAHNAVAASDFRPDRRDLSVNQTIIDSAKSYFHKYTTFPTTPRQIERGNFLAMADTGFYKIFLRKVYNYVEVIL